MEKSSSPDLEMAADVIKTLAPDRIPPIEAMSWSLLFTVGLTKECKIQGQRGEWRRETVRLYRGWL